MNSVVPALTRDSPFYGVELKLARANTHIQTLTDSVVEWAKRSPLSGRAEIADDRCGYWLILEEFKENPPIDYWGLVVGECVHNLRSALDNLCFSAARLQRDPPADPTGIQFPIFDDEQSYRKRAAPTLRQLPEAAAQLLDHFQPFRMPDRQQIEHHALLALQYLSNQDKHRVPQVALFTVTQHEHRADIQFASEAEATEFLAETPRYEYPAPGPTWPGSTLVKVIGARPFGKIKGAMKIEPVPAIQTRFGLEAVIPALNVLRQQAWTIHIAFRLTFPDARD